MKTPRTKSQVSADLAAVQAALLSLPRYEGSGAPLDEDEAARLREAKARLVEELLGAK